VPTEPAAPGLPLEPAVTLGAPAAPGAPALGLPPLPAPPLALPALAGLPPLPATGPGALPAVPPALPGGASEEQPQMVPETEIKQAKASVRIEREVSTRQREHARAQAMAIIRIIRRALKNCSTASEHAGSRFEALIFALLLDSSVREPADRASENEPLR
jgi:hypothetical protein